MIDFEYYINKFRAFEYDSDSTDTEIKIFREFYQLINASHYKRRAFYISELDKVKSVFNELSFLSLNGKADFKKNQRRLILLASQIFEENKRIFIVHGRDINMRDKVEAFLGKLRIENVILENEANRGRTVIEKFLEKVKGCGFAVVLMSADDKGHLVDEGTNPMYRARQNVVLELGFFLGKLGRDKIIVLHPDEISIEKPSDFEGIVYLPYDNKGAWKHKFIRELKAAKFYLDEDDINRV